ncbi:MAG TPA: hypothetical protein VHH33_08915 [Nitrososphaeraceae archaeon]|nr:hypothetical protein [Nitrososphaeraceae archaeon]
MLLSSVSIVDFIEYQPTRRTVTMDKTAYVTDWFVENKGDQIFISSSEKVWQSYPHFA